MRLEVRGAGGDDLLGWVECEVDLSDPRATVRGLPVREMVGGFGIRWFMVDAGSLGIAELRMLFDGINFKLNQCPIRVKPHEIGRRDLKAAASPARRGRKKAR